MSSNKLPHLESRNEIEFVTWRLHKQQPLLAAPERTLVCEAIEHFHEQRYMLAAYVVMDDHVHVVAQMMSNYRLHDAIGGLKSYTANRMQRTFGRRNVVWQSDYYDRSLRTERDLEQTLMYVANNPKRRWPRATDYQWLRVFSPYDRYLPTHSSPSEDDESRSKVNALTQSSRPPCRLS